MNIIGPPLPTAQTLATALADLPGEMVVGGQRVHPNIAYLDWGYDSFNSAPHINAINSYPVYRRACVGYDARGVMFIPVPEGTSPRTAAGIPCMSVDKWQACKTFIPQRIIAGFSTHIRIHTYGPHQLAVEVRKRTSPTATSSRGLPASIHSRDNGWEWRSLEAQTAGPPTLPTVLTNTIPPDDNHLRVWEMYTEGDVWHVFPATSRFDLSPDTLMQYQERLAALAVPAATVGKKKRGKVPAATPFQVHEYVPIPSTTNHFGGTMQYYVDHEGHTRLIR